MFGLDPFNRLVAVSEILLLLAFAALIGWLLGRLVLSGRINTLRSAIASKENELEQCRRSKAGPASGVLPKSTQSETQVKPVPESTSAFVRADPLLPAFAQDDTPELITEEIVIADKDIPIEVPPLAAPIPEVQAAFVAPVASGAPTAGNSEAAVLHRIAARAGELNFDRIGRATAAEADDLKDIVGIGPFLERKLHSLGIYTFRQVANFTKEDINKVNEIIEFFPGRIERDNWVDQSKSFHERKYGAKS